MTDNTKPAPRRIVLPENTAGRDFVVADIHGHFADLERELAARRFDPARDRLVAVGDLVDRGPQSARALEFLAKSWFFSVRGNHEQAMLDWLQPLLAGETPARVREAAARHAAFGGDWIVVLLQRATRGDLDDARRWQQALRALPLAIEIPRRGERIGIVHATVPGGDWAMFTDPEAPADGDAPLSARELAVLWQRRPLDDTPERRVRGIDRVYAGHNVVGRREQIGNLHLIETAVWLGNALTFVDLDVDVGRR